MNVIQLNRAQADALAIALRKADNGYQVSLLGSILKKAEVPEGKPNRKPSEFDRWKRDQDVSS